MSRIGAPRHVVDTPQRAHKPATARSRCRFLDCRYADGHRQAVTGVAAGWRRAVRWEGSMLGSVWEPQPDGGTRPLPLQTSGEVAGHQAIFRWVQGCEQGLVLGAGVLCEPAPGAEPASAWRIRGAWWLAVE